ncbi:MAG: RagB/SusD family nutrient uptake outer membrane protein [Bacteroidetes bacterium]|nr:RagB/SusD family nutrient uptake outer membrane protein [Bacteroidota bacterium]
MKKNLYLLTFTALVFAACHKTDKPAPPPPAPPTGTATGTAVGKQLSATDSLSSFNNYFKTAIFTDEDVAAGITVFAPSNTSFGGLAALANGGFPDSSSLKDYIVKGLIKAADLTNNKSLTTLSGKTLTVTVNGSITLVNGVAINTTPFTGDNFILYGASQLQNAAASFSYTVWDASQSTASLPKGVVVSGATVALYNSQESYASGDQAVYSVTTNNDGVAVFNGVMPRTYYVVASKGTISNVFKVYIEVYNGTYIGYAPDNVTDNNGMVKFKDLNMDQIVNLADIGPVPSLQVTAARDAGTNTTILMGTSFKPLKTAADAQSVLNGGYGANLSIPYNSMLAIDGMLSDDAVCGSQTSFCPYDSYTFGATDNNISTLWSTTYALIGNLNRVLNDVPAMDIAADQKADLIAQAKGLRAYVYLIMGQYFGDLPVHKNLSSSLFPNINRSTTTQIYNMIVADLTAALADLPATRANGNINLTKNAALGLLAKAALWKKDYSALQGYTNQIMTGSSYSLTATNSWLTSASNAENIWAPAFSTISILFSWYYSGQFTPTTVTVVPVLRYGQILLMDAEAQIALGNFANAQTDINALLTRRGQSTVSFSTTQDAMAALRTAWQTETYRQGDRFINLTRWGIANQVLAPSGYNNYNSLLPIPMSLISSYPNLVQNPGY